MEETELEELDRLDALVESIGVMGLTEGQIDRYIYLLKKYSTTTN